MYEGTSSPWKEEGAGTLRGYGKGVGLFLATKLLIIFHVSGGGMHTHTCAQMMEPGPRRCLGSPFRITSTQAALTFSPFFVSYS